MTEKGTAEALWLKEVLDRYEGQLVRYALRITGNIDIARDVVQDTFVKLCTARRDKIEDHLAPWLYTVCRNRALDVLRKERRMTQLTEMQANAVESDVPIPSAMAERSETNGRVVSMLATLPEKQQEVVRLKFQNGMTYKEISKVTGSTVSNVGYLIHTAIKTLRRRLNADDNLMQEAETGTAVN